MRGPARRGTAEPRRGDGGGDDAGEWGAAGPAASAWRRDTSGRSAVAPILSGPGARRLPSCRRARPRRAGPGAGVPPCRSPSKQQFGCVGSFSPRGPIPGPGGGVQLRLSSAARAGGAREKAAAFSREKELLFTAPPQCSRRCSRTPLGESSGDVFQEMSPLQLCSAAAGRKCAARSDWDCGWKGAGSACGQASRRAG